MADGDSSTPAVEALAPLEQALANDDVTAYREVRRAERAGIELPKVEPKPAESAPAQPGDQVASTDASAKPASEPGKPKGAKARSAELDPEIVELREKLKLRAMLREELARGDAKPAESSPAPKATSKASERFKAMADAPKLDDYQTFEDWSVDMADFAARKNLEEYSQKQRQDTEIGQFRDAEAKFDAKGVEAYPDFREVLTAAAQAGITWPEHVAKAVFTHKQGVDIAYALASAKDDHALYARLADPVEAGMVIGDILARLQPKTSPVSNHTRAPEPPITLGSRPHDKSDALQTAVDSDDFTAFREAKLAIAKARR